jgi:hypothetical protein
MEKPIIFQGDMVRAILDGRKTQTRRVIKLPRFVKEHDSEIAVWSLGKKPTSWESNEFAFMDYAWPIETYPTYVKCPYGKVGDKLWLRETHYLYGHWVKNGKTKTGKQAYKFVAKKSTDACYFGARYLDNPPIKICTKKNEAGWFKCPSIFMKKEDARTWVEKTGVRVERIQDITEVDAKAEGVQELCRFGVWGWEYYGDVSPAKLKSIRCSTICKTARRSFHGLWDSINKKRGFGWDKNPWVWVIEFKVIKP